MVGTPAIQTDQTHQILSQLLTGRDQGMQTMDQCLQELVRRNLITLPEARSKASSKETFPG
jgi:twitching motility protein PilT